jgi:hypothetical protein
MVVAQLDVMRLGNAVHPAHPGLHGLSILCPKTTELDLTAAYEGTEFGAHSWAGFLAKFQHPAGARLACAHLRTTSIRIVDPDRQLRASDTAASDTADAVHSSASASS